jgi:hypothetical protein
VLASTALVVAGCGGGGGGGGGGTGGTTAAASIVAANDLGMHCVDRDFSVFSILPPYNVLHAQVVQQSAGGPASLLDGTRVEVTYEPVADASGSRNSTSVAKTNFWTYASQLFGVALAPGALYRFSKGHGGVACQGCHGSTHAEWPNAQAAANDNVAANQLQGHAGAAIECSTCHAMASLPITTAGPHGLHNVGDARFVDETHGRLYERDPASCRACHGTSLEGTVLSRMARTRTFRIEDGAARVLAAGTPVSCSLCHSRP